MSASGAIKTLHLTNFYHPKSGGISTFYRALIRTANEQRRYIRLVVPGEELRVDEQGEFGRIYYVPAKPSPVFDSSYRMMYPFFSTGNTIRRILRDEQPDLVEVSDKYSLHYLAGFMRNRWVSGLSRRPLLVGTSHERMDDNMDVHLQMGRAGEWFARFYMRQVYFPMFDCHVANSLYTAEELIPASMGHRLWRGIWTLSMGVDCEGLSPSRRTPEMRGRLLKSLDADADARLLLYAGRLAEEKNIPLLVEMLERLPQEYLLLVAGAGDLSAWLAEANTTRTPNRIRLMGHVGSRERLAEIFAGVDAFVHPNPREPFGITPLEAMASGLPLVACSRGGITSYANQENAWLAEPDGQSFANAAQSVFVSDEVRARKVSRAREVAEGHDWPKVAGQFFELYDELYSRVLPYFDN